MFVIQPIVKNVYKNSSLVFKLKGKISSKVHNLMNMTIYLKDLLWKETGTIRKHIL